MAINLSSIPNTSVKLGLPSNTPDYSTSAFFQPMPGFGIPSPNGPAPAGNFSAPSGQVLGAATTAAPAPRTAAPPPPAPTATAPAAGAAPAGTMSPPTDLLAQNSFNAQGSAANAQSQAELQSLNDLYSKNAGDLQQQLGYLGTQKDQALQGLNTDLSSAQQNVSTQKQIGQTDLDQAISDAGNQAHNTQLQTRNVLRALGILDSSAGADQLNKPMNAFDQQRASLVQGHVNRIQQLDDFLNQQMAQHNNAAAQIQAQHQDLVGKIQSDLRFNDTQKADAIKAANAALQQHMADIGTSATNYQNSVNQQRQNFALQLGNILAYKNPTADISKIVGQGLNATNQAFGSPQSISIYDPTKKDQSLSGLGG